MLYTENMQEQWHGLPQDEGLPVEVGLLLRRLVKLCSQDSLALGNGGRYQALRKVLQATKRTNSLKKAGNHVFFR